jgi:hypothetical protein
MIATRTTLLAAIPAWLVAAAACAPAVRNRAESAPASLEVEPPRGGKGGQITPSDLAKVRGTTAADAVRQLRPEFLRVGGRRMTPSSSPGGPSVYVNGRHAGGTDALDLIPLGVLVEIRYLDAVAAKSLFGSFCPCDAGVILVRTRS